MKDKYSLTEQNEVKIYLKHKIRPLTVIFDTKKQKDDFIQELYVNDVIKVGPIIFFKENLNYIVFE